MKIILMYVFSTAAIWREMHRGIGWVSFKRGWRCRFCYCDVFIIQMQSSKDQDTSVVLLLMLTLCTHFSTSLALLQYQVFSHLKFYSCDNPGYNCKQDWQQYVNIIHFSIQKRPQGQQLARQCYHDSPCTDQIRFSSEHCCEGNLAGSCEEKRMKSAQVVTGIFVLPLINSSARWRNTHCAVL